MTELTTKIELQDGVWQLNEPSGKIWFLSRCQVVGCEGMGVKKTFTFPFLCTPCKKVKRRADRHESYLIRKERASSPI